MLSLFFVIVACKKDEVSIDSLVSEDVDLYCSIEEFSDTKTSVDNNGNVLWNSGDQVVAFRCNTLPLRYQIQERYVGRTTGGFSKVEESGSEDDMFTSQDIDHNVLVYPYSTDVWCEKADNNNPTESYGIDLVLPAEQQYVENSFGNGSFPMVAVSITNQLAFKNICGGMKLQLKGTGKVKSISLTGCNNELLSGGAYVTCYADGSAPKIEMYNTASKSVILNCGEGVQLNEEASTIFIIALPPVEFTKGFTVSITDTEDNVLDLTASISNTVLRSSLLIMPEINCKFIDEEQVQPNNEIWYTSSDGNIVTPNKTDVFGTNIISNTYENGQGIIRFDGDVTEIGENAFMGCGSLSSVVIPKSVTAIGLGAFASCINLKEFKGKYACDNGRCLLMDDVIVAYAHGSGTEYSIPNNVTTIRYSAFAYSPLLTDLTIPNSVNKIEPCAFFCPNLKVISGRYASEDGRFYIIDGVITIFAPSGLTECIIPDNVTTIRNSTFIGCYNLTSLTIPTTVETIEFWAIQNCENLVSVFCKATMPPTAVYNYNTWEVFAGVDNIYVPNGSINEYRKAAGWNDYADCIVAFDYDKGETVIANNVIYYTSEDGKIVEPYNNDDFGGTIISNTYENDKGVIKFDRDVVYIGYEAFKDCGNLTSITIPNTVIDVEPYAFYNCYNLKEFKGLHASDDGHCLIIDGKLAAYAKASGTDYSIPDNVTTIGPSVFCGFSGLTHIEIPDGITRIGYSAFQSCNSLTSVIIPDKVVDIGSQAFLWCFNLTDLTIGKSVKNIGDLAFRSCGITNLTIPENVTTIERYAFENCSNLINVTIGDGVTEIRDGAFNACYNLSQITIPESVVEIGNDAFANCNSLKNVYCKPTIPPKTYYWYGETEWKAFYGNDSDRKIYVPRGFIDDYKVADGWRDYASDIKEYDF